MGQPGTPTNFAQTATALETFNNERPPSRATTRERSDSRASVRPMSMIQTYQPPVMEVSQDTLPELQRIFTFLNSHSNKLYQEGYFLKFHDTDSRGRPALDRRWQEYFVQLVGTILSLWDASALDQAGGDAEVLPTFINLTDAAIHMIPSMTLKDGKKLDNILSVSTAASNKYLFHFDSYHALTQWTAGIRLAMFEHTTLSEAYTGALIAGKGKSLNNIRMILDRQCAKYEDWVRVRFGAGTPWRRCWCVVSPPDEKEYAKLQKLQKKGSYERPPVLKGDIKFYDTKKVTKRTKAIATVRDAYSCYAIYPQSKPLIDQSTLTKIEGKITVHSNPESTTDGFVFVMPESRPAISGFEIMLQFLFPVFDTFSLYGRPRKLIADVLDTRGLMFAMPSHRRYGYLEMWDVVGLINTEGSDKWSERQWRKQLKDLTSTRMMSSGADAESVYSRTSRRNTVSRAGFTPRGLRFEDQGSVRSSPSTRQSSPSRRIQQDLEIQSPRRTGTAPAGVSFGTPRHQRSVSEQVNGRSNQNTPSRFPHAETPYEDERPPTPPPHRTLNGTSPNGAVQPYEGSDHDESPIREPHDLPQPPADLSAPPQGFVDLPPIQTHAANQKPPIRPNMPLMKPNAAVDSATLQQMADASHTPLFGGIATAGAVAAWRGQDTIQSRRSGDYGEQGSPMLLGVNSRPPPSNNNSGNRLSTIPASPYVEHSEFVDPPSGYHPTAPPVPEHSEFQQQPLSEELPYRSHPADGAIQRKPVPGPSSLASREDDTLSTTSSRLDSLRNDVIDPEALDALNTQSTLFRQPSTSSSRYDDDAVSTSTPDYASVSEEEMPPPRKLPVRREDRPRSGVLTVIGDPNVKPLSDQDYGYQSVLDPARPPAAAPSAPVPSIDFGPTYALDFNDKRPGTSGTMTQMYHDSNGSRPNENLATTPNEQNRQSYISEKGTPNLSGHIRNGSASPDTRQVPWQPVMASPLQPQPDKQRLDPEEWVMQRASQHLPMMYGHGRSKSHTPPPFGRTHSGDWSQIQRSPQGSPGAVFPPSRPLSRGAELLLDQRPTTLSAREQEQVARMTNTPLLDLSQNSNKKVQSQPPTGLTGYIDHREKEKAAHKQQQYFPQQTPTPHMHVPGGWGTPTPQSSGGQYFPQQTSQGYGNMVPQQQQPTTQAYGASFDQAQQAARHVHQQQQGQHRR
ncbi:ph domain-containing [Pyrenophora seminiperda CCB06]|uniref:Ph domain-containing n=1 Tax=Pyrenophora seminiperda CCB06 TaxID=1302712 RepID=A0A3M7LXA8_9PLEO|nr:ph domain-containing [Pyrenophora seminiperda CCB06]